jgi:hypothetical protein
MKGRHFVDDNFGDEGMVCRAFDHFHRFLVAAHAKSMPVGVQRL